MSKAKFPFTFEAISICPFVLSITMGLVLDPLANIAVASRALPHSISVLDTIDPFTIVGVTCRPSIEPLARDTSFYVITEILISITEQFITLSMTLVIDPLPLITPANLIFADALTVSTTFN